jgi:hypothetical protein
MDSRLSYGQSDPGSIPAVDKLFSITCETLNFRDFVSVISFRCFCLGIGFGDIAPVNERREEVRVCVLNREMMCVCVCERGK